jgi:hypothetical protein
MVGGQSLPILWVFFALIPAIPAIPAIPSDPLGAFGLHPGNTSFNSIQEDVAGS